MTKSSERSGHRALTRMKSPQVNSNTSPGKHGGFLKWNEKKILFLKGSLSILLQSKNAYFSQDKLKFFQLWPKALRMILKHNSKVQPVTH